MPQKSLLKEKSLNTMVVFFFKWKRVACSTGCPVPSFQLTRSSPVCDALRLSVMGWFWKGPLSLSPVLHQRLETGNWEYRNAESSVITLLIQFQLVAKPSTNSAAVVCSVKNKWNFYPFKQQSNKVKRRYEIPVWCQLSMWSEFLSVTMRKPGPGPDHWDGFFVEID